MTPRTETVSVEGGSFDSTVVLPEGGSGGPGVLLFQEIFGVNEFVLSKAEDLAALGYVVAAPDVFWRVRPGVALQHDEAALTEGFGLVQAYFALPEEQRLGDLRAALEHLRAMSEVTGGVAAMGYCLGGTLAWLMASVAPCDTCVSYYGSGVPDMVGAGLMPSCPTLLHFGGDDPYISQEQVEVVRAAVAGRDDVELHVHGEAGHAFENFLAPQFWDPTATETSWPQTVDFLARTLA